jgi:pilus assembly protein FimV
MALSNAHAAGLGKLTVLSALGQPLRAEIALVGVEPGEAESLMPKLASPEAFQKANIELNPALFSLKFAVEKQGSRDIIRVTSTQAMNEPYIDMLLELGGNKGQLLREYTFLLDPPEMRKMQPAQIGSAVSARPLPPVVQGNRAPSKPSGAVAAQSGSTGAAAPAPAPALASAPAPASANEDYTVKKGDTLAKVANRYRGAISLDQMLVALYRANPDAFIDKNMNRMRTGAILKVPDTDSAGAIAKKDARAVVVAQAADFNRYRSRLAEKAAASAAKKQAEGTQSSTGKISTEIHEDADTGEARDKLKLSKSGSTVSAGSDKVVGGVSPEDLIAKEKALAEANSRVAELEKNVSELQKLLEVKNQALAGKQSQAQATAVTPAVPANPAEKAAPAADATDAAKAAPATETPSASADTTAAAAQGAPASAADAATAAPPPVKKPVKAKHPVVAPPPPPPAPSFFEDLTNNAMFLPGAALLLALLAGLGIYSARRRKQPPAAFDDSMLNDSSLKTNSLFGSTGGQSVDTNNSVFNSNFVPSASQLDTNEVDPIAEADVYIAYGRDAQAEEILKEALRNQPERHAVRVKLLEIYANRHDARSFEILASELYGMTKGEGDEWQQAANLGLILDPSNPLYASGANADEAELKAAALTGKTRRMDEKADDDLAGTNALSAKPNAIETSPYFNSTTLLTDEALSAPTVPAPTPAPAPESKPELDDLAFDLAGLDNSVADSNEAETAADSAKASAADPAVANSMPAEIADINFDFIDHKDDTPPAPAAISMPQQEASVSEHAALEPLPDLDLSDAAIERGTVIGKTAEADAAADDAIAAEVLADDASYSVNAEMATKLDLAMAYQEIGDKEGARELLEEVLKGGNPEQAEKARNSLAKLA